MAKCIKEIKLFPIFCGMDVDDVDVKYDIVIIYSDGTEQCVAREHTYNQVHNITIPCIHEEVKETIKDIVEGK